MKYYICTCFFLLLSLYGCGGGGGSDGDSLLCPLGAKQSTWQITTLYQGAECEGNFVAAGSGTVTDVSLIGLTGGCDTGDLVKLVDDRGCEFGGTVIEKQIVNSTPILAAQLSAESGNCDPSDDNYYIELNFTEGDEELQYNRIARSTQPTQANGECSAYSSYTTLLVDSQ